MKLTTERKPGSLVELNITADDKEFQEAIDKAITRQARNLQIPGFRKGKAPRRMVESYYGREAFLRDAADEVMDRLYRQALEQEELRPVGEPDVEIVDLEPVNFVVTVPVYPSFELGDYSSVRQEPIDASVSDEDVQEVLDRLQAQQSTWVDVSEQRTPKEGDQITIDYTVKEGNEDFQEPVTDAVWVLGETNLLQQLRDKIEEMHVGDTEEFELVFEEDDETADPKIRGKHLTYSVTLKGLKERQLTPIDDEFAKTVAGAESVEDLKQQIREDIHQGKTNDARNEVLNAIVDQIAEQTELDLPEAMIDEEVEHQLGHRKQELQQQGMQWEQVLRMSNTTEEAVKADMRPDAARRLRNSMLLQEIAKRENIEVSEQDLDAEIDRVAGADLNPDVDDEEARARAERLREVYNSDYFRNVLRNDMFEKKLTDRIIEIATEGKGAVLNGWTAPDPAEIAGTGEAVEATSETTASDAATADEDAAAAEASAGSETSDQ